MVEENHAYSQIIGSPEAPYWNFLASEGSSLTDFHALTHPSLPNYLALIGGSTFGLTTDLRPDGRRLLVRRADAGRPDGERGP